MVKKIILRSNPVVNTTILSIVLFLGSSCKKIIPDYNSATPHNFEEVFEVFWNQVNINYVYWDMDTTQWDLVYQKYRPIFRTLDLSNESDIKKSVSLFREMCGGLIDNHFHINFMKPQIRDSVVYPAYERKEQASQFHNPYPYYTVSKKYLDPGYLEGTDSSDHSSASLYCLSGMMQNKALYFYCSSFKLLRSYSSVPDNSVKPVLNYFISNLRTPAPGIRAVIVDLRNNPGGELSDLNFFVGNFTNTPLLFGYTRFKSGNGRLDYTPWINAFVNPVRESPMVNIPIIVLIDNFTASMAEIVTISMRCLSNCLTVGETSWGATGPITANEIYNDGQFTIDNFLSVVTSSAVLKGIDNKIYETIGIAPDITIPFDKSNLNKGIDKQLEAALATIP